MTTPNDHGPSRAEGIEAARVVTGFPDTPDGHDQARRHFDKIGKPPSYWITRRDRKLDRAIITRTQEIADAEARERSQKVAALAKTIEAELLVGADPSDKSAAYRARVGAQSRAISELQRAEPHLFEAGASSRRMERARDEVFRSSELGRHLQTAVRAPEPAAVPTPRPAARPAARTVTELDVARTFTTRGATLRRGQAESIATLARGMPVAAQQAFVDSMVRLSREPLAVRIGYLKHVAERYAAHLAASTRSVRDRLLGEGIRGPALDKLTAIATSLGVDVAAELLSDEEWDSPTSKAIEALKMLARAELAIEGAVPAPAAPAAPATPITPTTTEG